MEERFCPLISTDEQKKTCDYRCLFWDYKKGYCAFEKEKIITVSDGIKIAFGFILCCGAVTVFIILAFLLLTNNLIPS